MSHIVSIRTEIRDPAAVFAACRRLGLAPAVQQTVTLFTTQETGLTVELPGWRYPVVCELETGTVKYDNYQGHWGDKSQLDKFVQAYAVEKALLESRWRGHTVLEQSLADGSIKLTISLSGGVA